MAIKPVDIARRLGVSTTTLRKYEELGLVPPVSRSPSGYRIYANGHLAYFICVREMMGGFDLTQIKGIIDKVLANETDTALWMANKAQADLRQEKLISEKIISNLGHTDKYTEKLSKQLTVNDVSRETGIPASTIRYWDKIGLVSSERCSGNNYRIYTPRHIKQFLAVYALKFTFQAKGQRHFVNMIREEIKQFDFRDKNKLRAMKNDIKEYLNKANKEQIRGIAALYRLCLQVEKDQFDSP